MVKLPLRAVAVFRSPAAASRFAAAAVALSLVLIWAFPAQAGAYDIATTFTPSTTQAADHPDVTLSVGRSGTADEDIRDLTIDLPPGLIGNPEAANPKCTDAQFNADTCPANSEVGSVSAVASAVGLNLPTVPGTIYVLEPHPTDAATLGIVLRPPLGVDKIFLVDSVTALKLPNGDYTLRNTVTNIPRTVTLLGVPIDITLEQLTQTLNAHTTSGADFLTNPTSCQEATTTVTAVDYNDQQQGSSSSYTPTNCGDVRFDPGFDLTVESSRIDSSFKPTATITLPANEDPLHQSHVKETTARFPPGVGLDFTAAALWPICSDANFQADACPAISHVGTARVAVPVLPPDFVGDIYRITTKPGSIFSIGAVLRGPRGLKTMIEGNSSFTGVNTPDGPQILVIVTFTNLPQIPFTRFELSQTAPILVNPGFCQTRNAEVTVLAHSGAIANLSDPYTTTGCYPRAKGATPILVSLVPAYQACVSPNRQHGPPLGSQSCNPPAQESGSLTVGTLDANGQPAQSAGSERLDAKLGNTGTPANEADVKLAFGLTDVRQRSDLSDYSGELKASHTLRISDTYNGGTLDQPATVEDTPFEFTIPCGATAEATIGANCSLDTTANAVVPGIVLEGNRTTWQMSQVQVYDGGPDGDVDTPGNTVFARQGIFAP
jgi:hypothetical protein